MTAQVSTQIKLFAALVTTKRFFTGVGAYMTYQCTTSMKSGGAYRTNIRSLSSMNSLVFRKRGLLGEALVAFITGEGLLAGVYVHMVIEVDLLEESRGAYRADERSFVRMSPPVDVESAEVTE